MGQVLYLGECNYSEPDADGDINPVFCLCGCVIEDVNLQFRVEPKLKELKARFFGDEEAMVDLTQLIENGDSSAKEASSEGAEEPQIDLSSFISGTSMTVTAVAILTDGYTRKLREQNVYWHTLPVVMERYAQFISLDPGMGASVMKALSRGEELDGLLESEYERVIANGTDRRLAIEFGGIRGLSFSTREDNVAGLQISELLAHILARHVSTRDGSKGLMDVLTPKLYGGKHGRRAKYGLRVLPKMDIRFVD